MFTKFSGFFFLLSPKSHSFNVIERSNANGCDVFRTSSLFTMQKDRQKSLPSPIWGLVAVYEDVLSKKDNKKRRRRLVDELQSSNYSEIGTFNWPLDMSLPKKVKLSMFLTVLDDFRL